MNLPVYRELDETVIRVGMLDRVAGTVTFVYDPEYLSSDIAAPLSFSLPLQEEPFSEEELAPYFRGLLPEGLPLENLAANLQLPVNDYFGLLAACGLDCLGDVIIDPEAYYEQRTYKRLTLEDIKNLGGNPQRVDGSLELARLSLAGTQDKCGLYHDWSAPIAQEWFQPVGGAPSNAIVKFSRIEMHDLMVVEQLSMACARGCGVDAVRTCLIDPVRPAICVERYDRLQASDRMLDDVTVPRRRHQEDLTQAFGLIPSAKYRQLDSGTVRVIAEFLRRHAADPARSLEQLCKMLLFNYVIGNCDGHLKNFSILYSPDWRTFTLAPAYDMVSTTIFGRFSRELGMAIGDARDIDEVKSADILRMGEQLGLTPRKVRSIAETYLDAAVNALRDEGAALEAQGFDIAPYRADHIEEDMLPRLEVLSKL